MSPGSRAALEAALREALSDPGLAIRAVQPIGGGCISPTARIETTAGPFFAKWNDSGPADLFQREADGLAEMAQAASGLAIPDVIVARGRDAGVPGLIVMELLDPHRSTTKRSAAGWRRSTGGPLRSSASASTPIAAPRARRTRRSARGPTSTRGGG